MPRFKSTQSASRFLSPPTAACNTFNVQRHLIHLPEDTSEAPRPGTGNVVVHDRGPPIEECASVFVRVTMLDVIRPGFVWK